jgi:hypothetical protein
MDSTNRLKTDLPSARGQLNLPDLVYTKTKAKSDKVQTGRSVLV